MAAACRFTGSILLPHGIKATNFIKHSGGDFEMDCVSKTRYVHALCVAMFGELAFL